MAGIYIHIPFCRKACHYCNFHFSTSLKYKNEFLASLLNEIKLRRAYLQGQDIQTIYLGGGTPGLLTMEELKPIFAAIHNNFNTTNVQEVTIEMNPDDVTPSKLKNYFKGGINRISLGVQSFYDEDLLYMNRSHDSEKAMEALHTIKNSDFENYTMDLIYGYPLLDMEKWSNNLKQAIAFDVPHISCYAMTVEPKTVLDHQIKIGKNAAMDNEQAALQFEQMVAFLSKEGYEHYEISSFGKKSFRAQHNSNYWKGIPYLGLGPSAHSYDGENRHWNVAHNIQYNEAIEKGVPSIEDEKLSTNDRLNEFIMLSLRTSEGMEIDELRERAATHFDVIMKEIKEYRDEEMMVKNDGRIYLTNEGKLFADKISASLFVE